MAPSQSKSAENEMTAPPVSLGKPSLKARLEAYYTLTAPDHIADQIVWREKFEKLWDKFGGTDLGEEKLAAKLAKKYGTAVRLLTAAASQAPKDSRRAQAVVENVAQHTEEWYQLNEKERNSQCIDFLSDRFDPVAVLLSENRTVIETTNSWILQCPLLDRVDQFKSHLPPSDPLYRATFNTATKRKTSVVDDHAKKHKSKVPKVPSCFAATAALHQTGPLSVLYKAFTERQRVRVVTRYVNGIRGTLTGYLIAFDKHMNLILRDVDENYSPRLVVTDQRDDSVSSSNDNKVLSNVEAEVQRRQRGSASVASSPSSSGQCWTNRQRHMRQIMVRGDNVVAVYKAAEERSAWPVTNKSGPLTSKYRPAPKQALPAHLRVGTMGSLIRAAAAQRKRNVPRGKKRDYKSYS